MPEEKNIAWEVRTHEHREHSNDWYWTLGALAIAGAGLSVWLGNFLLAIIIMVGAGSIGYLSMRGPREHMIHVDVRGLIIDGTRYPFSSILSFWIEQESEYPRLLLTTNAILNPRITIPLDSKEQGEQVRAHLRTYIKEEEQNPHMGEHLAEIFGL